MQRSVSLSARNASSPLGKACSTIAVVALLAAAPLAASADKAHTRPQTVDALQRALSIGDGQGLSVTMNGGSREIAVGQSIAYGFEADRDGYLTVLHLDGEGVVTLLYPNTAGDDGRVTAATTRSFPPGGQGLSASLPTGIDTVYAFATAAPLELAQLGLGSNTDDFAVIDPEIAPAFATCLADHLAAEPKGSVRAARVRYAVKPADAALPYDPAAIETYFTTKTRSIRRPSMNLLIHFESDSDELSPDAIRKLDQVGKALKGNKLKQLKFELAGHTDDVGDDSYNKDLSMRRARSAHAYLNEKYDVTTKQLSFSGHGESKPKMNGQSDEARQENRRVELELVPRTDARRQKDRASSVARASRRSRTPRQSNRCAGSPRTRTSSVVKRAAAAPSITRWS